jgi:hypothetical protein
MSNTLDDVGLIMPKPGRRNDPRAKLDTATFIDPNTPDRPKKSAPDNPAQTTKWVADYYLAKGWKTKAAKQQTLQTGLNDSIRDQSGPNAPNNAKSLETDRSLKAGKTFTKYIAMLKVYEGAPIPRDDAVIKNLSDAAVQVVEAASKIAAKDREYEPAQRKARICQARIDQLMIEMNAKQLGGPPWDSGTEMTAASLKAQSDIASLPLDARSPQRLNGGGVNCSFWINKASGNPQKPDKSYLYKPAANKSDKGVPPGGEPAREALTGRAADLLGGMMGIDLGVPQTHIVQIDRERFPEGSLTDAVKQQQKDERLVGSLQQVAIGAKDEMRDKPPSMKYAVPAKRCQELAILDTVTLAVDRHGGNLLMTGDDQNADLVPIDHGLTFSPDLAMLSDHMASATNSLLSLPGSHQPFSKDMLTRIEKISPNGIRDGWNAEVATMKDAHGKVGGMIDGKQVDQSRRATMFLKLAAPSLTPASLQVTMGQNAKALFDPNLDDQAFATLAKQIIARAAGEQKDVTDYFLMSKEERRAALVKVKAAGWPDGLTDRLQTATVLLRSGGKPPAELVPGDANTQFTPEEEAEMNQDFARAQAPRHIPAWRIYKQAGKDAGLVQKLVACGVDPQSQTPARRNVEMAARLIRQCDAVQAMKQQNNAPVQQANLLNFKEDQVALMANMTDKVRHFRERAAEARQQGNVEAMDKLRDEIAFELRPPMTKEIEALWKWSERQRSKDEIQSALEIARENLQEGAVVSVRRDIDEVKKKYNYTG